MPIVAQEIIDRVRQVGLDAEGADYYSDTVDIIPSINAAVEWLTAIINSAFGQKKMGEEVFQDLVAARVFQASDNSRIYLNPSDLGHELWTILGVYVKPKVKEGGWLIGTLSGVQVSPTAPKAIFVYPSTTDLSVVTAGSTVAFTYKDKTTGVETTTSFIVQAVNNNTKAILVDTSPITDLGAFLNIGDTVTAKAIYLKASITSTPIIDTLATPDNSIYRPDLVHISSEHSAKRLTVEEWAKNSKNPFMAGNEVLSSGCDTLVYAYMNYTDYGAPNMPYTIPREIEIRPSVKNEAVTVFYARRPKPIVTGTDNIEFPGFFSNWIFDKALQYISFKQGDGTTIYNVTAADINTLLQSVT